MTDEFDYDPFTSTTGLSLNNGITKNASNYMVLTTLSATQDVNGLFRTTATRFDENWTMRFHIEVGPETNGYFDAGSSPYQADGWAIVWATSSTYFGSPGGSVGYFGGSGVSNSRGLAFRIWYNRDLIWSVNGAFTTTRTGKDWRGDKYYWLEYDYASTTLRVYAGATSDQPAIPNETFTGVTFGTTAWYVGITAATGAATMNSYLKSWGMGAAADDYGWGVIC